MKIIDEVLKEHEGLDKKDVKFKCPSHYGFEQPTFKECRKMSCEECWSREVKGQ